MKTIYLVKFKCIVFWYTANNFTSSLKINLKSKMAFNTRPPTPQFYGTHFVKTNIH